MQQSQEITDAEFRSNTRMNILKYKSHAMNGNPTSIRRKIHSIRREKFQLSEILTQVKMKIQNSREAVYNGAELKLHQTQKIYLEPNESAASLFKHLSLMFLYIM